MSAGDDSESAEHLAWATDYVTTVVNAAWNLPARIGDGIGEQVRDAVLALVTERSPRAKYRMISDRPELLGHEAERFLDHCTDLVRSRLGADPSHIAFFESHREMIKLVRAGEVGIDGLPAEPPGAAERTRAVADSLLPRSAAQLDDLARTLRDQGRIEAARKTFHDAVRKAREEGDGAVEGSAHIGLFTLVMRTAWPAPGSHEAMLEHARRAADAYRRAGAPEGECEAVVAMITVLTDTADRPDLDKALDRLARLDRDQARWWRVYSDAMTSADPGERKAGLRWCVESAALLGEQADFYGRVCAEKLAVFEGRLPADAEEGASSKPGSRRSTWPPTAPARRPPTGSPGWSSRWRRSAGTRARRSSSGSCRTSTRALTGRRCCAPRAWAPPNRPSTTTSSTAAAPAGAKRDAPDVAAVASADVGGRAARGVRRLFGRYLASPTAHNRRLLALAFEQQRKRRDRQEQDLLAATPGPATAPPPVPVRSFRTVLADGQRAVVYGATGAIFLIARDECRVIGRFPARDVDEAVSRALAHLSDPADSSPAGRDAVAWLAEHVVRPVADHVPQGSRLFLVPHGPLWQVPLGALGPVGLAETRDVSYVPSLTLLARQLTAPRLQRAFERFVGFGDPDGSLPHARAEMDHAASMFADSFTVFGDVLRYHSVMANLADADVAHLACHGTFFADHPDFSALHIAGPPHDPEVLWQGDLARYELNARLVVLAACHGGTGRALSGGEYVGFPGAFLAAGARGVLAPLWAVPDDSTATLMRHFYDALGRMAPPAAALREAQHALAAAPATAHPFHWAGFQLFGAAPGHRPFGDAQ
ncbi:CHAT domain-containing protein [Actinomadura keratinilytica]|uniref:CHAT domain-containing protein n=1 Tax=Actinomadura keratinilytica TaxID=547461 RepID=UPI00360791B1